MTGLDSFRRSFRRIPKAAFWLVTPWRMPDRLRFLRQRAAGEQREQELRALLDREHSLLERLRLGEGTAALPRLDLFDDIDLSEAAGLPPPELKLLLTIRHEVSDKRSAAGFCIGLLRSRPALRARFPRALSQTRQLNAFLEWLQSAEGQQATGLAPAALAWVVGLFAEDFAARARQTFLADRRIRQVLPHGLTPAGQRGLFHWFMGHARHEAQLSLEEILWLFMQAAEDPGLELVRAYLFTPDWQRRFPDALTVFGWQGFAGWFMRQYGAEPHWLDPARPPDHYRPAQQLRIAYGARPAWRASHPDAMSDSAKAFAWLEWLARSDEAELPIDARRWCERLDAGSVAAEIAKPGLNIVGHFCHPSGVRVSVESIAQALTEQDVGISLRDVYTDVKDDPCHAEFDGQELYDITLIHTQPEPFFREAFARADVAERSPRTYRIAYWYWEFDSIPDAWIETAKQVDEVWTATEFIARGLRERLPVPVRTLFPGVKLRPFEVRPPADFGLPEDRYSFLFTFHMMSVMERKNPLGLIRAFKMAFRDDERVSLVLKTVFGERQPAELQKLRDAAAGADITIIDRVFSPDEVLSLLNACDAYVSLHRSEGLGLTMAEAMLLGKPVVATAFSGNMDFMNEDNSLLVPFELVKLDKAIPPYDAELEWAEPSIEDAARHMRRLYEDRAFGRELGARAQASARARLSLAAAGRGIKARLAEIEALQASEARNAPPFLGVALDQAA